MIVWKVSPHLSRTRDGVRKGTEGGERSDHRLYGVGWAGLTGSRHVVGNEVRQVFRVP